jgi:hypothetical protein
MKDIYKLQLLEETFTDRQIHGSSVLSIRRVPGGWIFTEIIDSQGDGTDFNTRLSCVFVPYNDEFKPKQETTTTEPFVV